MASFALTAPRSRSSYARFRKRKAKIKHVTRRQRWACSRSRGTPASRRCYEIRSGQGDRLRWHPRTRVGVHSHHDSRPWAERSGQVDAVRRRLRCSRWPPCVPRPGNQSAERLPPPPQAMGGLAMAGRAHADSRLGSSTPPQARSAVGQCHGDGLRVSLRCALAGRGDRGRARSRNAVVRGESRSCGRTRRRSHCCAIARSSSRFS